MQNSTTNRNAYALPLVLIAASFFIALAFTKDAYQDFLTKKDDLAVAQQQSTDKKSQLDALNALRDQAKSQT